MSHLRELRMEATLMAVGTWLVLPLLCLLIFNLIVLLPVMRGNSPQRKGGDLHGSRRAREPKMAG